MGTRDPRVDAYIDNAAPFARPILTQLREAVHAACPEVEEDIKWRGPAFVYRGMLAGMMAFKAHCGFGFWKGKDIPDAEETLGRLETLEDLPPKRVIAAFVKQAMRLNQEGVKQPRAPRTGAPPPVPPALAKALRKNAKARLVFEKSPPSHQREYIEWIAQAKRDETRARRVATALDWLAQGKSRNWKYEK